MCEMPSNRAAALNNKEIIRVITWTSYTELRSTPDEEESNGKKEKN